MHRHLTKVARLASISRPRFSSDPQQLIPLSVISRRIAIAATSLGNQAEIPWSRQEVLNNPRLFSTSAAEAGPQSVVPPAYVGKIVGKLINSPKYLLKHELIDFFEDCGLTAEKISTYIDERLRTPYWRLLFDDDVQYRKAQHLLVARKKMGTRNVRLEQTPLHELALENDPMHPNRIVDGFRGKSLVLVGLPDEVSTEQIERFFHEYSLAPYGIRYARIFHESVRTPLRMRVEGERRISINIVERRAVVKFQTELDCLRALRELQKTYMVDRLVELRLLQ